MLTYMELAYKSSCPSTFFLGWGVRAELGTRAGTRCPLGTSTSYLCPPFFPCPSSLIPLPPQDSPPALQQKNLGGGIVEQQQPGVQTQDSQRLEQERATHSPSPREEEGPSGAT